MENPVNGSLFWLLLRYAELVNPNRLVKPAPAVSSSYYSECLRRSGNASRAEETCAVPTWTGPSGRKACKPSKTTAPRAVGWKTKKNCAAVSASRNNT